MTGSFRNEFKEWNTEISGSGTSYAEGIEGKITGFSKHEHKNGEPCWSWDNDKKTLTLNGVDMVNNGISIKLPYTPTEIVYKGINSIKSIEDNGIFSENDIKLRSETNNDVLDVTGLTGINGNIINLSHCHNLSFVGTNGNAVTGNVVIDSTIDSSVKITAKGAVGASTFSKEPQGKGCQIVYDQGTWNSIDGKVCKLHNKYDSPSPYVPSIPSTLPKYDIVQGEKAGTKTTTVVTSVSAISSEIPRVAIDSGVISAALDNLNSFKEKNPQLAASSQEISLDIVTDTAASSAGITLEKGAQELLMKSDVDKLNVNFTSVGAAVSIKPSILNQLKPENQGKWSEGHLEYFDSLTIVTGKGDGIFDPKDNKHCELGKNMLSAAGYGEFLRSPVIDFNMTNQDNEKLIWPNTNGVTASIAYKVNPKDDIAKYGVAYINEANGILEPIRITDEKKGLLLLVLMFT